MYCTYVSIQIGELSILKIVLHRLTDIENRLVVASGREEGRTGSLRLADANYCVGWMNNKVLLYNTENYIQYPVINHSGKEYEKEFVYV